MAVRTEPLASGIGPPSHVQDLDETTVALSVENTKGRKAGAFSDAADVATIVAEWASDKVETLGSEEKLRRRLEFADHDVLVEVALRIGLSGERFKHWWPHVAERLKAVELQDTDAVLILHCMVQQSIVDKELLTRLIDLIETRYFGMKLGLAGHKLLDMFEHDQSYQSLINMLPVDHKVKLILLDDFVRPSGKLPPVKAPVKVDAEKKWRTVEPVEMEAWEREQFFKGRLKVKRVRHVDATINKMRPGKKLRSSLAMQLAQMVPRASIEELAKIAQVCAVSSIRLLPGDLQRDFEDAISTRVLTAERDELRPFLLAFASALRKSKGSKAYAAWRKKLLPLVFHVLEHKHMERNLLLQRGFHSYIGGILYSDPNRPDAQIRQSAPSNSTNDEDEDEDRSAALDDRAEQSPLGEDKASILADLAVVAERAAQVFVAVATGRFVVMDTDLSDTLSKPLVAAIARWKVLGNDKAGSAEWPNGQALLPIESIADVVDASISSGVENSSLIRCLGDLILVQISLGMTSLADTSVRDLAAIAHGIALLPHDEAVESDVNPQEVLQVLWHASKDKLKSAEPPLVLMLLNAFVRGGSEELITSKPFLDLVDEHLTKRLDFDPRLLGHVCS